MSNGSSVTILFEMGRHIRSGSSRCLYVANMPQLCVTAYGCIVRCSLRTICIVSQIDYCLRPQRRRWPSTAGGRRIPPGVISNVQYIYRTVLTGRQKNNNAVIINVHLYSHSEHYISTMAERFGIKIGNKKSLTLMKAGIELVKAPAGFNTTKQAKKQYQELIGSLI
jgi:hypothetical protein